VNVLLKHTHPLHKVTIIPRGRALGVTMSLPKEDMLNMRKKQAIDTIIMTMAGRIAEEFVTEDISSGAAMDIQQATQLARAMVMHWGMSDKLGNVLYGDGAEYVFLGRDMMSRAKDYSEQTALEIDAEVKRIIVEANNTAKELIATNRDKLEIIANALLEHETLEGSQVVEIVRTGSFTPPPKPPANPGPMMGAPAGTPLPEAPPKAVPPTLPGLGSPSPAPA
jgi:cell division protease FtsH